MIIPSQSSCRPASRPIKEAEQPCPPARTRQGLSSLPICNGRPERHPQTNPPRPFCHDLNRDRIGPFASLLKLPERKNTENGEDFPLIHVSRMAAVSCNRPLRRDCKLAKLLDGLQIQDLRSGRFVGNRPPNGKKQQKIAARAEWRLPPNRLPLK